MQRLQSAKQFYASLNWLCCQQEREPTQVTPPLEAILSATQAIAEAILPATRAMLAPFSVKEYSERETYPFLLYQSINQSINQYLSASMPHGTRAQAGPKQHYNTNKPYIHTKKLLV